MFPNKFEQQLCKLRKNNQSGTGTTKHTFYKVILLVPNTIINFQVYAFGTVKREQQTVKFTSIYYYKLK